jgi:uncharacterized protein (DUF433 family)
VAAFSEEQTEKLTGITKSQLRYWDNTGFYSPSYTEENRRISFSRVYSFKDIVALRVLNVLRNQFRVSLQHLRDVSAKLRALDNNTDRWIDTRLYPLNKRVIWYEPGSELPQEVASGQYVSAVVLNDVVQNTKQAVDSLQVKRSRFGSVEKSRYVMHNAAVISGTRIPVNTIKRFAEAGYTVQQIIAEYPDLTEQDIQAALRYKESSTAA